MAVRFGTDGVRGLAVAELTPEYVLALGRASAAVLGGQRMLVGRDTRRSGPLLEAAFAAGVAAEGVDAELLGVLPTPAIAHLAAAEGATAAVITASHNPFADNGVKVFAAGGRKLDDDVQARIEATLDALGTPARSGAGVGSVRAVQGAGARYVIDVAALLPPGALAGLTVVLDCANGATSEVAGPAFRALGAEVVVEHAAPNGVNINDGCGATYPGPLGELVVARGADLGLAFDGDGDRVIAVDHLGRVVDGDRLIALSAIDRRQHGRLADDTVVVTVMANLGFHRAMAAAGIQVVETPVGDRHVLAALDAGGYSLGGEQSGHVIHHDLATTGDGVLAGMVLAEQVRRSGRSLAELADEVMTSYPQVLVNLRTERRHADPAALIGAELDAARARLGDDGRVLVRASGTEPLVRVMVEAPDEALARSTADALVDALRTALS
jgi:phosphoglucosamine mutase